MKIKSFYALSFEEKNEVFSFCKSQYNLSDPASINLWHDNWGNKSNTLPYILNYTSRFKDFGDFYIVYDDNIIAAIGGVYRSSFSDHICLAGVRAWTNVNYRNKSILKDTVLLESKRWAIQNDMKIIALSFNEYNKGIVNIFKRSRFGETKDRLLRTQEHLFYNGIIEVSFPVKIQNVYQYVIYERLDSTFEFDWSMLK